MIDETDDLGIRYCACKCGNRLPPSASRRMKSLPGHRQKAHMRKKRAQETTLERFPIALPRHRPGIRSARRPPREVAA